MAYHRRTLNSLVEELQDSWEASPFWTEDEAIVYINHSLRTWNLLTGYWKKKVLLGTSGGSYHTLPGALTFGMVVVWGATMAPLQISSLADLDFGRPRWEEETTASGGDVPDVPILWAPVGLKEIAIWPHAVAGQDLLIDGVAATPILAALDDYADIDDWVAGVIVNYALHVASFKRGAAAVAATAGLFKDFITAAAQQNERLRNATYFRKVIGLDLEKSMRRMVGTLPGQAQGTQGGGQ